MPIDVDALRAATPGTANVAHLNNAGAALPSQATLDAVLGHLKLESSIGGYEAEDQAAEAIAHTRRAVAELLGASADEIALTTSDTAAWGKAFWGLVNTGGIPEGDRVLVDRIAYNSHYMALLQASAMRPFSIEIIPSEPDGTLSVDALKTMLDDRVALVTTTHIGTHRGLVNPVADVGALCRAEGIPFYLDACQSIGQLPVNVHEIGCDVATGTGRKWLRGPRGTGVLYVRTEFLEHLDPPGIDGASASWTGADTYELFDDARRFEEFETSVAARIGLGVAIDQVLALGIDEIASRIGALAERLRTELAAIAGVTVHDGGQRRSGIVTFSLAAIDAFAVKAAARAASINVSVSSAPNALLDMQADGHDAVVRASPHAYNTDGELDRLLAVVRSL